MSAARVVVSNWKYSRLYNVGVHDKILANQGGGGWVGVGLASQISFHPPLERFDGFMLRFIEWTIFRA